ncbi:MAG: amino acid ABC transporter substrate-binding protein [Deltaproteobacteria bacterium]|nr:amino acid ABC transporter substrate-binding protein [Deltaproteobacteria bacterium]
MNRTLRFSRLGACVFVLILIISFPFTAYSKDKIIIGAARPLSGPLSFFEANAFGPIYKMWVDEVNAKGGIYVKEYGKRLPVEMLVYDDKSDMGTMTRLLDKLILKDKVDFVFPPASTAFLFAAGAIANRHGYILMGAEGGATSITQMLPGMPYFFGVLNFSDRNQMPVLAEIFEEVGVKTAAIMFIEDLHGIEYSGVANREFTRTGIEVKMVKSVPPDIKDVSHILKEAKKLNVDAFCSFTYPDTGFLVTGTAQAIGYNPKAFLLGPGGNFAVYKKIFGKDVVEGVMGEGAWNCKSSPEAKEFCDKFTARYPADILDWWGHLFYWAGLQFFEQAIEKAGTLNQKKIREVMATAKFNTVLGPTWFQTFGGGGGLLAVESHPGQIGQWQNGVFEVIGPKEKRTAPPVYPKPKWPKPKKKSK